MTAQVLFFDDFSEKDPLLNVVECYKNFCFLKENLKNGRNMNIRPLYTFTTNDLSNDWFK